MVVAGIRRIGTRGRREKRQKNGWAFPHPSTQKKTNKKKKPSPHTKNDDDDDKFSEGFDNSNTREGLKKGMRSSKKNRDRTSRSGSSDSRKTSRLSLSFSSSALWFNGLKRTAETKGTFFFFATSIFFFVCLLFVLIATCTWYAFFSFFLWSIVS